ncbi:MAG: hypothetical protein IPK13_20665 [Deltaproteobacteria bacterium]|nr:hypothetical protein [Deltaproteobacteria bacterium]
MAFTTNAGVAAEQIIRNRMTSAPVARHASGRSAALVIPNASPPDLTAIYVEVHTSEVAPVSEAAVDARLRALEHARGTFSAIVGERTLEPGHEVLVDFALLDKEHVIPGTIGTDVEFRLDETALFPELAAKLVGHRVGDHCLVDLTLGADVGDQRYAFKKVRASVQIKAAREVLPADANSQAFRDTLEAGISLDGLREILRQALLAERVAELRAIAVDRVLDAMLEIMEVDEIPSTCVDEHIRQEWARREGSAMARMGLPFPTQQASLSNHLRDAELRDRAERHLEVVAAFRALVAQGIVVLTEERFKAEMEAFCQSNGVSLEAFRRDLAENKKEAMQLADALLYRLSLEHIMNQARVVFVDDDHEDRPRPEQPRAAVPQV